MLASLLRFSVSWVRGRSAIRRPAGVGRRFDVFTFRQDRDRIHKPVALHRGASQECVAPALRCTPGASFRTSGPSARTGGGREAARELRDKPRGSTPPIDPIPRKGVNRCALGRMRTQDRGCARERYVAVPLTREARQRLKHPLRQAARPLHPGRSFVQQEWPRFSPRATPYRCSRWERPAPRGPCGPFRAGANPASFRSPPAVREAAWKTSTRADSR